MLISEVGIERGGRESPSLRRPLRGSGATSWAEGVLPT